MLEPVSKHIFISTTEDLRNKQTLLDAGITHIVSISETGILVFPKHFKYRLVNWLVFVCRSYLETSRKSIIPFCRTRPRPKYLNRKKERTNWLNFCQRLAHLYTKRSTPSPLTKKNLPIYTLKNFKCFYFTNFISDGKKL